VAPWVIRPCALKVNREARELARSIEHPFSLAYAQHHTSWLYQLMRMPSETLLFSDEQMRISSEHGFPLFNATGAIYCAAGQLLQKKAAKAAVALEDGLDAYRATGARTCLAVLFWIARRGIDGNRQHW
jgi:hypothetical protein